MWLCLAIVLSSDVIYDFSRLPWNQRTVFGWIGLMILSMLAPTQYLFVNGTFLLLFIAIYEQHCAFFRQFRVLGHMLSENIRKKRKSKDIKMQLCELIEFHISVKK